MIDVIKKMVFFAGLLLAVISSAAYAEDTFRIADIRIDGLQRVSPGSVFAALPVNTGDEIDVSQLQNLTRTLFRTGYFDDIQINRDHDVLVIKVVERPTVAEISISGNKIIKTEELNDALKKAGLAEGQIYKPSTLEAMSSELERQYVGQGRYGAKVKTEVRQLPRNRVGISIGIDEGEVARIKAINIIGNTVFPTEDLVNLFQSETSNWLSWATSNDKYAREKMEGDLERLRSYYMDRGYLRFEIESTQVSLSDNKESIFITVNIHEGSVYTVSEIDFSGQLIIPEEEVRGLVSLKPGETFSQVKLTNSQTAITKRLGNEGYTYAEVKPVPERNETDKTVKITFSVLPHHRAYVNRINFRGNTKTADDVLRREMRQMESATADSSKIEQSKTRLERLGYFKTVDVKTTDVPGTGDQIDVEYAVEEQPSGSIGASVGFAQGSGLILGGSIQQDNFLGTGKQVGINVSTSSYMDQISFTYTDPYYTVDGVSRGFNLYYSSRDLSNYNVSDYSVDSYGLDMNFGYPISEIERLGFGIGYAHNTIKVGSSPAQEISGTPLLPDPSVSYVDQICLSNPSSCILQSPVNGTYTGMTAGPAYKGFLDRNGNSFNDIKLTASWNQSTLNKAKLPTSGFSQNISFEGTAPAVSDLEYFKAMYRGQVFKPLSDKYTLRFRGRFGFGSGYGGTDELPFFENFYGGGFGSVRGFKRNTLGPRGTPARAYQYTVLPNGQMAYVATMTPSGDKLVQGYSYNGSDDPIGGNVVMDGSVDLIVPTPFVKDQTSMQTSVFFDFGNVYSTNCSDAVPTFVGGKMVQPMGGKQINCTGLSFSPGDLRYSTGVGLTWMTSFGPLMFSVAKPLNAGGDDQSEVFQFSMGQNF
ncbi:MAG TPA: outer membrane protein assembly factor BamA [Pseudomonadales bacterium]|nr:outer membrane protein assembly factor BamA [Pseudomonadales bacterium]